MPRKKKEVPILYDGHTGQMVGFSPKKSRIPTDIPSIVERYISLVAKVICDMDRKAETDSLQAHEVNSVAAIGRAVAMLQAVESASLTRIGGKSVKEHTSAKLRELLAASGASEGGEDDPSEEL